MDNSIPSPENETTPTGRTRRHSPLATMMILGAAMGSLPQGLAGEPLVYRRRDDPGPSRQIPDIDAEITRGRRRQEFRSAMSAVPASRWNTNAGRLAEILRVPCEDERARLLLSENFARVQTEGVVLTVVCPLLGLTPWLAPRLLAIPGGIVPACRKFACESVARPVINLCHPAGNPTPEISDLATSDLGPYPWSGWLPRRLAKAGWILPVFSADLGAGWSVHIGVGGLIVEDPHGGLEAWACDPQTGRISASALPSWKSLSLAWNASIRNPIAAFTVLGKDEYPKYMAGLSAHAGDTREFLHQVCSREGAR